MHRHFALFCLIMILKYHIVRATCISHDLSRFIIVDTETSSHLSRRCDSLASYEYDFCFRDLVSLCPLSFFLSRFLPTVGVCCCRVALMGVLYRRRSHPNTVKSKVVTDRVAGDVSGCVRNPCRLLHRVLLWFALLSVCCFGYFVCFRFGLSLPLFSLPRGTFLPLLVASPSCLMLGGSFFFPLFWFSF